MLPLLPKYATVHSTIALLLKLQQPKKDMKNADVPLATWIEKHITSSQISAPTEDNASWVYPAYEIWNMDCRKE